MKRYIQGYQQYIQKMINQSNVSLDDLFKQLLKVKKEELHRKKKLSNEVYSCYYFNSLPDNSFSNLQKFVWQIEGHEEPFDLLYELNQFYQHAYQKIPIDALLALCIAFFSYFKNIYPLEKYEVFNKAFLKQEYLYMRKKREEEFLEILSDLESQDPEIVHAALLYLKETPIPKTLTEFTIKQIFRLLDVIEKTNPAEQIGTCNTSFFGKNLALAFNLLVKIITPETIDEFKTRFIKNILKWNDNFFMLSILEQIPILESDYQEVLTKLQACELHERQIITKFEFIKKITPKIHTSEVVKKVNDTVVDFLKNPSPAENFADLMQTVNPSLISSENAGLLLDEIPRWLTNYYNQLAPANYQRHDHYEESIFFFHIIAFYRIHEEIFSTEQKNIFINALIEIFKNMPAENIVYLNTYIKVLIHISLPDDQLSKLIKLFVTHYSQCSFEHTLWFFVSQRIPNEQQREILFNLAIEKISNRKQSNEAQSSGYFLIKDLLWKMQPSTKQIEKLIQLAIEDIDLDRNYYRVLETFSSIEIPPHLNDAIFVCLFNKLTNLLELAEKIVGKQDLNFSGNSHLSGYFNMLFRILEKLKIPKNYIEKTIDLILINAFKFSYLKERISKLTPLFNFHYNLSEKYQNIVFNNLFSLCEEYFQLEKFIQLPVIKSKTDTDMETLLLTKITNLIEKDSLENILKGLYQSQITNSLEASVLMQIKLESLLNQVPQKSKTCLMHYIHALQTLNEAKTKFNELNKDIVIDEIRTYLRCNP